MQVGRADKRVCRLASVSWGTHLLKRTFILDAFGSNKYPAVSEGQLLHRWAPKLVEQPPSLFVHPVMKVHISYFKNEGEYRGWYQQTSMFLISHILSNAMNIM